MCPVASRVGYLPFMFLLPNLLEIFVISENHTKVHWMTVLDTSTVIMK
jgi:hypothetical protein